MSRNKPVKDLTPSDVNRQMMEIKKKIQLSEGQRKAVFEDCEAERKSNHETIQKLTKEISEMIIKLHKLTNPTTEVLKNIGKPLEHIIGPIDQKTTDEIEELLRLQIIDKCKALDLINYKTKKRQNYLEQLGKEYHILLTQKHAKEITEKVDIPLRKATCDLQNAIHAVEVQLREANHISARYQDIKKSLLKDSARFESNIKKIEDELHAQNEDIKKLKDVVSKANQMRSVARGYLIKEEKLAMSTANSREKQTAEGKRLVNTRKQELELLEKRIFQTGKVAAAAQSDNNDAGDDAMPMTDEEGPQTPLQKPQNSLSETFEILKQATGATSTEEVLERFSAQRNTLDRLIVLRKKSEAEKKQLERKLEGLNLKLEQLKFAEVKETERKSSKMEQIETLINKEKKKSEDANLMIANKKKSMQLILKAVQDLHVYINPLNVTGDNTLKILTEIKQDLNSIFAKTGINQNADQLKEPVTLNAIEEKWLPPPYSGLVRRTPLPQTGLSPGAAQVSLPPTPAAPATVSDEEEDVPSRTYLKRQAQLVVDAKSRRKNIRLRN